MKRNSAIGVGLLILIISIAGFYYWQGPEFEWGVNVGDEFLCEVRVFDNMQAYTNRGVSLHQISHPSACDGDDIGKTVEATACEGRGKRGLPGGTICETAYEAVYFST